MGFLVEVAYATADEQVVISVPATSETTVRMVVERSGLLERFPGIDMKRHAAGIYGVVCSLDHSVREGDRIELYRPLLIDPKEARRARADDQRH